MIADPMNYPTDLHGLHARLVQLGMNARLEEHKIYKKYRAVMPDCGEICGTERLLVESAGGWASVIRGMISGGDFEIAYHGNEPFDDVERFPDEESCAARIVQLMTPPPADPTSHEAPATRHPESDGPARG